MRKVTFLIAICALVIGIACNAQAVPFSPTQTDLYHNFTEVSDDPIDGHTFLYTNNDGGSVEFAGALTTIKGDPAGKVWLGVEGLFDLSGYSSYDLHLENTNNNDYWSVGLFVKANGDYFETPILPLAVNDSSVLSLDLNALSAPASKDAIEAYGFIVYKPEGADNDIYHITATSVPAIPTPEPSSILLLGSGFVGLTGWLRRSYRKSSSI